MVVAEEVKDFGNSRCFGNEHQACHVSGVTERGTAEEIFPYIQRPTDFAVPDFRVEPQFIAAFPQQHGTGVNVDFVRAGIAVFGVDVAAGGVGVNCQNIDVFSGTFHHIKNEFMSLFRPDTASGGEDFRLRIDRTEFRSKTVDDFSVDTGSFEQVYSVLRRIV